MKQHRRVYSKIAGIILFLLVMTAQLHSQCTAVIGSNIDPVAGCEVLTVQFYDNSSGVVTRSWDFGDGSAVSNAQNPTHSFQAGEGDTTYTVILTIVCSGGSTLTAEKIVTVYAKPQINFSKNKSSVCAITDSVCLTNLTIDQPGNSYLWNFGDGTISTEYEPCKVYSTPGSYSLELTVTNEHGCMNSLNKEDYFEVIPVPNTAFTVRDLNGCIPFTEFFINNTDTAGNSYTNWTWDYGDGEQTEKGFNSPPHTYLTPGKFNITLGTTNSLGCSNFSTQSITVKESPVAHFTAESPICKNSSSLVEFTGTAGDSVQFDWEFEDASSASGTGEGPYSVSWDSAGIKKVNLKVSNQICSDSITQNVVVNPLSKVQLYLSVDEDTICSGQEVTFTASPEHFLNYMFHVNDIMVHNSPENIYKGTGFNDGDKIYLKVTDNNGCTEQISDTVYLTVLPTPSVALTSSVPEDTICTGTSFTVTASPSGYDTYSFYLGNSEVQTGTSNAYTVSDPSDGQYIYVRSSEQGCESDNSNIIKKTVTEPPAPPSVNCGNTSTSSIEFVWDEIPGAAAYEVSVNGGIFEIPSSGSMGFSHLLTGLAAGDSITLEVRADDGSFCGVGPVSQAQTCVAQVCNLISFETETEVEICQGEDVVLNINNITASNFSVAWNNETPGRDSSYSFAAASSTTIPITLTDSLQLHCPPASKEILVNVIQHPEVTISASTNQNVCAGTEITFTASPGDYNNYKFFNNSLIVQDGPENIMTVTEADHNHFYFVIASGGDCLESSDSIQIFVNEPLKQPTVNMVSSDPGSVTFEWDAVTGATGYMVSINDGSFINPSSGITGLTHVVMGLIPGEAVTVSVIALGAGACGDSNVSQPAVGFATTCTSIDFSIQDEHVICLGDSVELLISDINLENYSISWDGGAPGLVRNMVIYPDKDMNIMIVVKDTDQPDCPGRTAYVNISVNEIPEKLLLTAPVMNDTICEDELLSFTASPAGYDYYEFYDGFKLLQTSTDNSYTSDQWTGGHEITARAWNKTCVGESSDPIAIEVKSKLRIPQVNCSTSTDSTIGFKWEPVPDAEGYMVSINGAAFQLPSSGAMGSSHLLTGLLPADDATISVVATGQEPCGFSLPSVTISCSAGPCDDIDFIHQPYDTICEGETLSLSVTGITIPDYTLAWNGGAQGSDVTFSFQGLSDTVVSVMLTDNTQAACSPVTKYFEITVNPLPIVTLTSTAVNDSICEGELVQYIATPAGWDQYQFFTGTSQLLQDSGFHILETDTFSSYHEIYVQTMNSGCSSVSNTMGTSVLESPPLNLTGASQGDLCYGTFVEFTASPGYDRYLFKGSSGIIEESDQNILSLEVKSSYITVQAYNGDRCAVSSDDTIRFNLLSLPEASLVASAQSVCPGESVAFTASPYTLDLYEYYRNGSLAEASDQNQFLIENYRTADTVSLVVTDQNGCRSNSSIPVVVGVEPFPDNKIIRSAEGICLGDSVMLTASLDSIFPTTSFYWNTGVNDTTFTVAPFTATNFQLFSIWGGCTVMSDSITIGVDTNQPPVAYAGEDITLCIFDSTLLVASGGTNYSWSPDSLVSNPLAPDVYASADTTTHFVVTVSNRFCYDTDTVTVFIDLCLEDLTAPVPQIITPNGDGINDRWIVDDIDYFTENYVEIFNRWGHRVYSAQPYLNTWEGRSNGGQELPEGTYYYVIDLGNGTDPRVGYIIVHR